MSKYMNSMLYGLFTVFVTMEIFADARFAGLQDFERVAYKDSIAQYMEESGRIIRSASDCDNTTTPKTITVEYGKDVTITCLCDKTEETSVKWFDAECRHLADTTELVIQSYNDTDSTSYLCKVFSESDSRELCSARTDITGVEKIPSNKSGVAVFFVILAVLLVISICVLRKYKARISLCMRDTCKPNNGRDGKEYDAYVSLGLTDTDRKFVEGFVGGVLKKKYNYHLFVDERNLLPKLDYSDKLQSYIGRCRRLIIVFSSSYMSHDWCKYCFNEGLRKIVDLNVPTLFIITDHSILSELRSHSEVVSHIPQILLTHYQTSGERQKAIEMIRRCMPAPMRNNPFQNRNGMRSPMLSDAESIHKSDINLNGNGTGTYDENGREYTFGNPPEKIAEEIEREYDEALEEPGPDDFVTTVRTGGDVDPDKVKVHQYEARKDFYSLTMADDD